MSRDGLTRALALLCVPALLAGAALLPLAAMDRADRARLEAVHPLPGAVDTGAPSAEALRIPLVEALYRTLLVRDTDAHAPYLPGEDAAPLDCAEQDVRDAFDLLRPALPGDWAALADTLFAQAEDAACAGWALEGGFSRRELTFSRTVQGERCVLGTLELVLAPDGVTPVQMNLYLNAFQLPRPAEFAPPQDPADPLGALEDVAGRMGLGALDWQSVPLDADGYWCLASEQAHLRLVLHAWSNPSVGTYLLDVALTMVEGGLA